MKAWLLATRVLGFPAGASAAEPLRSPNVSSRWSGTQKRKSASRPRSRPSGGRATRREVLALERTAELHVRVRFERKRPGLFHAALWLSDRAGREVGRRELSAKARHCSALDASLALVVALLVDTPPVPAPSPPPASSGTAPLPSSAPPEGPRERPTPLTLPADTYAPREPWWFAVTLSGVTAFGLLPAPAFGAALALGVRPPHFSQFWVSAEVLPERRLGSTPSATLAMTRFGLMLCPWEFGVSALRGAACAGQRVGFVSAAGDGFDVNQSTRQLSYDLASSSAALGTSHAIVLAVRSRGRFPIARPAYISRSADGARRHGSRLHRAASARLA